ncbi:hypothetical protein OBBRIDRAFT_723647 [Obba rivulosa]|uniref:STB6-like N-terminal domain-containing protein n=1 Tax=Obba rivulosa TaxID=1052685 RepID=A0A8E2J632_9APHY|nr:hypothetical protein OBBRIDRAFT_723647 [Obba rivulosa]
MPTVRPPRPAPPNSPVIPHYKSSPSKAARSRAGSLSVTASPDPGPSGSSVPTPDWIGGGRKFEVVEDQLELEGFVIYAVEKCPQSSLSQTEAQSEWDLALRYLKKDGARPKETEKGVIMVTSLASFPSDFTIVQIPGGNFLEVREQLYTNIDLLRMGCSGRSALTLEEPSDTTKDRFISMYHVLDKATTRMSEAFRTTVLELVTLVQTALAMFNLFEMCPEERNGLLCDITCEGVRRWVSQIAEPVLKLDVLERAADPNIVAALLSLVCIVRNKLHVLGFIVPKDPFVEPQAFLEAVAAFQTHKSHGHSHVHSLSISQSVQSSVSSQPNPSILKDSRATSPSNTTAVYLSAYLIKAINIVYDKKTKQSEPYKVHRVLKNKLDDLATDLRSGAGADTENTGSNAASSSNPITDINTFVQVVASGSKDAPPSLRYLWTGRPGLTATKRNEKEVPWSEGEREDHADRDAGGRDKEGNGAKDADMRSTDDEGDGKLWAGKVARKLEGWSALTRAKKLSVDFGHLGKVLLPSDSPTCDDRGGQSGPSILVSKEQDDGDVLSSGQVSPSSDYAHMQGLGSMLTPQRSAGDVSDYDRRVSEFDQRRPPTKPRYQSRIISWSDPFSARGLIDDADGTRVPQVLDGVDEEGNFVINEDTDALRRQRLISSGPRRRRSFDDIAYLDESRLLSVERMRIDVELCGQILVMRRREAHLANVAACLEALTERLSRTNTRLREDHDAARPGLATLMERAVVLQQIEAALSRADALTLETNALRYESDQFLVEDLWHMAMQPRQRVLALREKAFGTGRRRAQGVRGAHGRFNRIQWTLDGRERLVDNLGRTESEADEEDGLAHVGLGLEEEEEEVDAVEHQTLRPTWLLRFFNYWGSKWGPSRRKTAENEDRTSPTREGESDRPESMATGSSPLASSDDTRRRPPASEETRS